MRLSKPSPNSNNRTGASRLPKKTFVCLSVALLLMLGACSNSDGDEEAGSIIESAASEDTSIPEADGESCGALQKISELNSSAAEPLEIALEAISSDEPEKALPTAQDAFAKLEAAFSEQSGRYDEAIATASPEVAEPLKTLKSSLAATITPLAEAISGAENIEDFKLAGLKVMSDPSFTENAKETETATTQLNEFATANCGFEISGES